MASSLAGSIFGTKSEESSGLTNLFESSSKLPAKPAHKPLGSSEKHKTKKKTRKVSEDGADGTDTAKQPHEHELIVDKTETKSAEKKETKAVDQNKTNLLDLEAESRTIFVGNLPLNTTRKMLASLFRSCGKVESSRLRSLATTGVKVSQDRAGDQDFVKKVSVNTKQVDSEAKSSVQGYVVFADKESIEKALGMNNKNVEGHRIRVDRSKPTLDASRSVFVGNLPYYAKESTLRQHFSQGCGLEDTDIENVRIVRDKETMQCKGFGYVLFREKSMVTNALQQMHEKEYMRRKLRVTVCGKRFKNRQGAPKEDLKPNKKRKAEDATGALKRILAKDSQNKKRKRGETKNKNKNKSNSGLSRRAAVEAKTEKRVKKLKKRMSKGMGKQKS